ncbi:MAG: isochorismatase family protein, partial [Isosphaeraceae bacterium]|nr:isochorismatase family protein [Isosphaeraceae bacterium]
ACAHRLDDPDPEPFPPHCLVGTPGQGRVWATARAETTVIGPDEHLSGELPRHLTLEKRRYDLFSHPDAARLVALYGRNDPMFVVYGVATDYCVQAAVLGLLDRGYRVAVVADAVRAVDPEREPEVLTGFVHRGALLTLTDVICDA